MERSDSIAALATALAKAQGSMEGAAKDSANPFYKSKYADLASVWSACRWPLAHNSLAVIQAATADDSGVTVATLLAHESGEWIKSDLRMIPKDSSPQAIGSCISYARRYALASMVGVFQADDDANVASGKVTAVPQEDPLHAFKVRDLADRLRYAAAAGISGKVLELHEEANKDEKLYAEAAAILGADTQKLIKSLIVKARKANKEELQGDSAIPFDPPPAQ